MLAGLLILLPLLFSGLVFFSGKNAKVLSMGAALLQFALAIFAYVQFKHNPSVAFLSLNCTWLETIGARFSVSLDGLSILMILLSTGLVPLIIMVANRNTEALPSRFYGLLLFMQMALNGVFMCNDGFLFYIFWELALIPIYFICLLWGGENRARITFKFFIYTLLGSLFMLIGLIYLYQHSAIDHVHKSWAIHDLYRAGHRLPLAEQGFVFWCIFVAFAIKMPIFPFHTWQPDTYVSAPTAGTMLLSGIMLKMGTFGLLKWIMPMVPLAVAKYSGFAMGLAVFGVIYASCIAIAQKDYKRLIAYSSIAHVGIIAAGILSGTHEGIQGAMVQMLAHGVSVVGLFLIADILVRNAGSRNMDDLGGIRNVNPNFAVLFLIILLGAVALPLTNGFVGEFLILNGIYHFNPVMAAMAGLSVILGAVYMLRSYQFIMLGETNERTSSFGKLHSTDNWVLVLVSIVVIGLGIYPKILNDLADPAVSSLMHLIK